jgi:hypothetical protein
MPGNMTGRRPAVTVTVDGGGHQGRARRQGLDYMPLTRASALSAVRHGEDLLFTGSTGAAGRRPLNGGPPSLRSSGSVRDEVQSLAGSGSSTCRGAMICWAVTAAYFRAFTTFRIGWAAGRNGGRMAWTVGPWTRR